MCSPDEKFVYYMNFAHNEGIQRISTEDGSTADVAKVLGDPPASSMSMIDGGPIVPLTVRETSNSMLMANSARCSAGAANVFVGEAGTR